MQICVSGWYFEPQLFDVFKKIQPKYDITVLVYHERYKEKISTIEEIVLPSNVSCYPTVNGGLEFGVYDYFLKNIWDGESDVLFMHDDIRIHDISFFDKVSKIPHDQAFIFKSELEEIQNGRIHGRCFFCSKRFLKLLSDYQCNCKETNDHENRDRAGDILLKIPPHKGFWFDIYNFGEHASGMVPKGVRHYNTAVYHFGNFCDRARRNVYKKLGHEPMDSKVVIHFPEFEHARRGKWRNKQGKWGT